MKNVIDRNRKYKLQLNRRLPYIALPPASLLTPVVNCFQNLKDIFYLCSSVFICVHLRSSVDKQFFLFYKLKLKANTNMGFVIDFKIGVIVIELYFQQAIADVSACAGGYFQFQCDTVFKQTIKI